MITRTLLAGAIVLAALSGAAMAARHHERSGSSTSSGSTAGDTYCGQGKTMNMGTMECEPLGMRRTNFHTAPTLRHPRSWTDIFENRP